MNRVHPILTSTKSFVEGLKKYKQDSVNVFPRFDQSEMVSHPIFGDSFDKDKEKQPFFVNEENNPTLTRRLQELIEEKV